MIDLHCHYLPGVDDGAADAEEGLRLLRAAAANGITAAALTPHVNPRRYANTKTRLLHTFIRFQDLVKKQEIPVKLFLAGEVRLSLESLELFEKDEVPFLGEVDGYKIVLLEFPHDSIPVGSEQFIARLLSMRVRPLIAHPERNKYVMRDPERIRSYVDMGCWLQLTAGSLTGTFGKLAKVTAIKLLEQELAWVIATDSHNISRRPPDLAEGCLALSDIVGPRMANKMVTTRPSQILGIKIEVS